MKTSKILMCLLFIVATQTACWVTAQEGTVLVQTIWDKTETVVRPESGGLWSVFIMGDDYYLVSTQANTKEVDVTASSKDNAALTLKIAVTYRVTDSDEAITNYVKKFGLDGDGRDARLNPILAGQVNTETKNAVAEYDAYGILANQEDIQKRITEKLTPIFANQLYMTLESVQIIGRPDFLDDRIETSASQVVANQKLKEAASALLEKAKIDAETKQVEAQTFSNPALLEIRKLELQKEIATEWSKHQGTLVFGNSPLMLSEK